MAVDSRDKRFSMMGLSHSVGLLMPNPDGGFGVKADRFQLLGLYRSAAAALTPATYSVWRKTVSVIRVDSRTVTID
jgi:hypothetical protein